MAASKPLFFMRIRVGGVAKIASFIGTCVDVVMGPVNIGMVICARRVTGRGRVEHELLCYTKNSSKGLKIEESECSEHED